jgi:transcriptional regulator
VYVPRHFREERLDVLHRIIEDESFATLVTSTPEGIVATHIPFLLDRSRGPLGTLRGHVARANPHWQHLANGSESLVVFLGPHAYVSPTWYGSTGRVPTWNYVAVHAYGTPRPFDDEPRLREIVVDTARRYESGLEPPWSVDVLDPAAVSGLLKGIVGFEIPIARLDGKRKLGQNRARAEREGMVLGLRAHGRDDAAVIADLVEADLAES